MSDRSERIRFAIAAKKLSYTELERLTGVSKSALQRYASGETKKIPVDVIEKIAAVTGVTAEYLMGWDANSSSDTRSNDSIPDGFLSAVSYAQDQGISPDELKRIIDLAVEMRGGKK